MTSGERRDSCVTAGPYSVDADRGEQFGELGDRNVFPVLDRRDDVGPKARIGEWLAEPVQLVDDTFGGVQNAV